MGSELKRETAAGRLRGSSRRQFLQGSLAVGAVPLLPQTMAALTPSARPLALEEFRYDEVQVSDPILLAQRDNVTDILLGLDEDSLLKPFREMANRPAPGVDLGGWYQWVPDYDFHHDDVGLAPGATFGQWVSALARLGAASRYGQQPGNPALADRALRLNALLAADLTPDYFRRTRFPAYSYDKLVCGLMDAHTWAGDSAAWPTLDRMTTMAEPAMPGRAVDREVQWSVGKDLSWMWDESYTVPENLYLASSRDAGSQYREMARTYLNDVTYFQPLSDGANVLSDKHAYSYVNALCSAMQAYLVDGSAMHLQAARTGFALLEQQSFATGAWGPDEELPKPGYDRLARSLTASHNSFETPCGSYAHAKLTRYLLRATRDGRYGDSMERVLLNTVRGALPLKADGRSFYYADYNWVGKRIYSLHRWPCCSGTLPQVVADYGINTYLHDPTGIWINLYHSSEVRWAGPKGLVHLQQSGTYLDDGKVQLLLSAAEPSFFALSVRIPGWTQSQYRVSVNGAPVTGVPLNGFLRIERTWHRDDRIDLQFAPSLRLEPLPSDGRFQHDDTVALLYGPRVLFALRDSSEHTPVLQCDSASLLAAERTGPDEWTVHNATGSRRYVPFTHVGDALYSTYVKTT